MNYQIINEQALMIYLEERISEDIFKQMQQVVQYIHNLNVEGITEIVPSYRAILINIDIEKMTPQSLVEELKLDELDASDFAGQDIETKTVYIPVLYGGEAGPDIDEVASTNNLDTEEVIDIHSSQPYLIYMLGFMPGFPFLGGLDERLHTTRRSEPRTRLPEGSVGIANQQTGLYPSESPGGWQIIGRTPIKVFDLSREPMCLYQPGDYIKFYAISEEQYDQIIDEQESDSFDMRKWVSKDNEYSN
ncbi:5-oxoprolinase subunit PxpB [Staphylococcus pettenkoferi]|uniref:5-oxoprolinase subunit PxpB n=1 Tax=Staphylococcus pettenkoferi TaxID=170573 RepID=UPI0022725C6E|nr:5-oxoprolinase subunit PxpB [Staphylococcus pettenkoferi]MCY1599753.1 5-oxoprolinase subunit PxpB [Staphylococcus pettenkoferi]